jgi:hypothetical protein
MQQFKSAPSAHAGIMLAVSAMVLSLSLGFGQVHAASRKAKPVPEQVGAGAHSKSSTYRRGPQVRGFVQRRGGYSYGSDDTINTTGPGRGLFSSTNAYRNYQVDRQTGGGPFDHGFFFDGGGIAPRGGNSPYIN